MSTIQIIQPILEVTLDAEQPIVTVNNDIKEVQLESVLVAERFDGLSLDGGCFEDNPTVSSQTVDGGTFV